MNHKVMALLGCLTICWVEVYGARPNILFCIMDDASWAHMSAYGCEWVETLRSIAWRLMESYL